MRMRIGLTKTDSVDALRCACSSVIGVLAFSVLNAVLSEQDLIKR
jgi:hypothetical protein